jgi:hypothetical protein
MKNAPVGNMAQKINFTGNCDVKVNADGTLTIRIGENLNASTFNTTDGQTDVTSIASAIKTGNYRIDGDSSYSTVWKKGADTSNTMTITIKDGNDDKTDPDKIHFDDKNATFTIKVSGYKDNKATSFSWTSPKITESTTF